MTRRQAQLQCGPNAGWRVDFVLAGVLMCALAPLLCERALALHPPQPGINWVRLDGAEQCLSAAVLVERVEARVRELQFTSAREAEVFVDGSVRRAAAGGWDVRLEVSAPDGRVYGRRDMHFEGEACSVIEDGVALVIAVTLYPAGGLANAGIPLDSETAGSLDALFGSEPTEPTPDSVPVAVSAPPLAAQNAQEEQDARPRDTGGARSEPRGAHEPAPWNLYFDVAGFGAVGQLPGASLGLAGYVELELPAMWPIEIGARIFRDGTASAPSPDDGSGRFELLLASIATCPWSPAWLPALRVCAGAEAGRLRAAASGFAVMPPVESDAIANLLASGVVRVRLTDALHLRAAAAVVLPLIQHEYTYRSATAERVELFRMPQVAGRLEIGAGMRF